ncbi:chaplin [Streptomyces zagrosensis]|uniref:Chaplin domain-containing protein n=1 Tax=Streptomyces zagrosensis TaxID=1042984 RepID=A0A7W9UXH7_9ACTN|nr:chaplin [Streptomyces zagrosensis]MBB5933734.1 hypothetical protein [Streptomyces zagrosensis]
MSTVKKAALVIAAAGVAVGASSGAAFADSGARGNAVGSPGVLSGDQLQVPVHVPINLCGNTVSVIAVLNPAVGNTCINA